MSSVAGIQQISNFATHYENASNAIVSLTCSPVKSVRPQTYYIKKKSPEELQPQSLRRGNIGSSQFNYNKLINDNIKSPNRACNLHINQSPKKVKPERPPQPKNIPNGCVGVLIDFSIEDELSSNNMQVSQFSTELNICNPCQLSTVSILDQPIDVPQEQVYEISNINHREVNLQPPPYQQPPSYSNNHHQQYYDFGLNLDIPQLSNNSLQSNVEQNLIKIGSFKKTNDPFDTSYVHSDSIVVSNTDCISNEKDIFEHIKVESNKLCAKEACVSTLKPMCNTSQRKLFDKKFVQELEKNLGKKEADANSNDNSVVYNDNLYKNNTSYSDSLPRNAKFLCKYSALEKLNDVSKFDNSESSNNMNLVSSNQINRQDSVSTNVPMHSENNEMNVIESGEHSAEAANITVNSDTNSIITQMWKQQIDCTNSDNDKPNQNDFNIYGFKSNRNPVQLSSNFNIHTQTVDNLEQRASNYYDATPHSVYNEVNDHCNLYNTHQSQPSTTQSYHLYSNDTAGLVSIPATSRLYDEVFEGTYGLSSQSVQILRPHRPAPPCPLEVIQNYSSHNEYQEISELGPQSAQQLERKLGLMTISSTSPITEESVKRMQNILGNSGERVSHEKCLSVLQAANGNIDIALKNFKLDKLIGLGVGSREQCEAALQTSNWNVEVAASVLLDNR